MAAKKGPSRDPSEQAFLDDYDPSAFERPSVAIDVVVLTAHEGALQALLVRRQEHPHKNRWSLPGGFVRMRESLDAAAARVLRDKAGVSHVFLEQLYSFGEPKRDPRTRVISIAYYALVAPGQLPDTSRRAPRSIAKLDVPWEGEAGGPVRVLDEDGTELPIAFDHGDILGLAVKRIRGKLDYVPIGFQLLPPSFTLRQLQEVHETILGRRVNKDSFRRRMLASGMLAPTGARESDVEYRPAQLYRFTKSSAV